jgi:hypothetical protein
MRISPTFAQKGETATITHTIKDDNGVGIADTDLITLTLTLRDEYSGGIINDRDAQDVLNANGGTVNSLGGFELFLDTADNPIVDSSNYREWHVAALQWSYTSGANTHVGKDVLKFKVWNDDKPLVDATNSVGGVSSTQSSWFSHRGWC